MASDDTASATCQRVGTAGNVDQIVYVAHPVGMSGTTTIRVSRATRDTLNDLAAKRGETLTATITRATRLLEQEAIGNDLSAPLRDDELTWLDADAG